MVRQQAAHDVDPPLGQTASYIKNEMTTEGYRHLLAVGGFATTIHQLCHILLQLCTQSCLCLHCLLAPHSLICDALFHEQLVQITLNNTAQRTHRATSESLAASRWLTTCQLAADEFAVESCVL